MAIEQRDIIIAFMALSADPTAVLQEAIAAPNEESMIASIMRRLGITEAQARVVVNTPFRQLSQEKRALYEKQANEL